MGKRNDGLMGLFIGITRSGKSTPIKAMIPQAKRLLIWDVKKMNTAQLLNSKLFALCHNY